MPQRLSCETWPNKVCVGLGCSIFTTVFGLDRNATLLRPFKTPWGILMYQPYCNPPIIVPPLYIVRPARLEDIWTFSSHDDGLMLKSHTRLIWTLWCRRNMSRAFMTREVLTQLKHQPKVIWTLHWKSAHLLQAEFFLLFAGYFLRFFTLNEGYSMFFNINWTSTGCEHCKGMLK